MYGFFILSSCWTRMNWTAFIKLFCTARGGERLLTTSLKNPPFSLSCWQN